MHSEDRGLKSLRAAVDAELDRLVPECGPAPARLTGAMRHSLLAPGKRVRALLTLLAARHWGGDGDVAMVPACALEMVHAASLILDDLPAMDDSALRRGLPANHRVFGEGTAMLAAIGLMNGAFAVAVEAPGLDDGQKTLIVRELSWSIGTNGLVAGQEQDLHEGSHLATPEAIEAMHGRKTGALFAAACVIGAVVARRSEPERESAKLAGYKLGVAFQTLDDLLDCFASQDDALKDVGKDAVAGKPTLLALLGRDAAMARAQTLLDEATELLGSGAAESALQAFVARLHNSFLSRFTDAERPMDRHGHG